MSSAHDSTPQQAQRSRLILGVLLALLLVAVVAVAGALANRGEPTVTAATPSPTTGVPSVGATATTQMPLPKGVTTPRAGLVVNADTAPAAAPTLHIYEDFQCPVCARAHRLLGGTITDIALSGKAKVAFHPMVFLDRNLNNTSSTTVGNAAACAADAGKFLEYHHAALEGQPTEGTGYPAEQVQQFAVTAGLRGAALDTWMQCESSGRYRAYLTLSEEGATADKVTGTPTFVVNRQVLDVRTISPQVLLDAIVHAET